MYYLKRKIKKGSLKNKIKVDGLCIKSSNKDYKNVTLVDKKLSSKYSSKKLDKKLKLIYDKIFRFLTSDDDSESGIKVCLGEIEKFKMMVINQYKEYLQNKKYREYLAKIVIIEEEFKSKYHEREYYARLIENMYKQMEMEEMEEFRNRGR